MKSRNDPIISRARAIFDFEYEKLAVEIEFTSALSQTATEPPTTDGPPSTSEEPTDDPTSPPTTTTTVPNDQPPCEVCHEKLEEAINALKEQYPDKKYELLSSSCVNKDVYGKFDVFCDLNSNGAIDVNEESVKVSIYAKKCGKAAYKYDLAKKIEFSESCKKPFEFVNKKRCYVIFVLLFGLDNLNFQL
ncbi:unnamed protein product [Oikopleura dioica]|uniref:Uncharacterized protein n=1 Tax=Oikopleura dioica TaxID=34765 RepID=E4X779_OIKDI|nr:unnamed protein product [Oikopleura dioica]